MKGFDAEKWTDVLLEFVRDEEPLLDFVGGKIESKVFRRRKVIMIDKMRYRDDGLFDRLFFEYEFFKLEDPAQIELSDLKEFGWLVRVQYAINKDRECPIPCLINGGYCNLFDLTDYVEVDEDFVNGRGSFVLGEESERISMRVSELADFLASSIPLFVERMLRERIAC